MALITLPQRLLVEARRHKTPTRADALLVMTAKFARLNFPDG
jgi:hypothetical protein